MLFSSSIFLFFFLPLVIIGYQLLKQEFRLAFLSLASLFFYGWGEARYLFIMLLSIAINYISGLLIYAGDTKFAAKKDSVRKAVLFFSVACNLGMLFYFKYLNFAIANINSVFHTDFVSRNIVMPLGISFFTFQGMSYVIDLYFGKVKVQLNPILLTFYISFFPQLIAGPIVRYIDIEGQICERERERERVLKTSLTA